MRSAVSPSQHLPPVVFQLAGHPLGWRLLSLHL
jgi:hypothetical protein